MTRMRPQQQLFRIALVAGVGLGHELHVDVSAAAADAGLFAQVAVTSASTSSAIAPGGGGLDWTGFPPTVRVTPP